MGLRKLYETVIVRIKQGLRLTFGLRTYAKKVALFPASFISIIIILRNMPASYRKKAPLFPISFPPQSRDGACDTVYSDPLTQKPQYNTCERKRGSVRSGTNRHCSGRRCTGNRPVL